MKSQCESCGKSFDENDCTSCPEDGSLYCPSCIKAMTLPCSNCGTLLPVWDMAKATDDGEFFCDNCVETTKETEMSKSKISSVLLNRAEGPSAECGKVTIAGGETVMGDVLAVFSKWGQTAPDPDPGGYDKCDFTVVWENGDEYAGRFDMQKGGTDGGETFWTSLKGRLEYYACLRRPLHFKDAYWEDHCEKMESSGDKAEALRMLAECEGVS
jgi:hypothetical protein